MYQKHNAIVFQTFFAIWAICMAIIHFTSQGSLYYLIFGSTALVSLEIVYFGLCMLGDTEILSEKLSRIAELTEEMQSDIERIKDFHC